MPRNWLNIFTAVRNANAFEADQEQRAVENRRADERLGFEREDQGFDRAQETRTQTDWDAERMRETSMAALTAYGNAAANIQDPEARGMLFDRFVPALAASGFNTDRLGELRSQVVENPEAAGQLVAAIRAGRGSSATYSPRAVIDPQTGRAVYVAPGSEVGREPADDYLAMGRLEQGDRRLGVSRDTLQHRIETDDPDYQRRRAAARSEGAAVGEMAAGLPRLNEVTDTALSRIDALISNPNLDAIFGLPNLSRLDTGGFGAAGVVPGSPAADALAQLNETIGDVQTAAYESLRGGGQITEAEREAIAQGLANLERAQSPQRAIMAAQHLAGVLDRRRNAVVAAAQAGVTGRSNAETAQPRPRQRPTQPGATPRQGPPSAAPQQGGLRQPNESADDLLGRLGL